MESTIEGESQSSKRFLKTSRLLSNLTSDLTCEGSTFETMYGEITDGSFLNILKKWNSLDNKQLVKYVDIGCGRAFTVFLARSFFEDRIVLSCGIEISLHRLELFAFDIFCKLYKQDVTNCKDVFFIQRDVTCFESLEPFTHIFFFCLGYPEEDLRKAVAIIERSTTVVELATSIKPEDMKNFGCESMTKYYDLVVSLRGAKSCGSKTIYLYQRNAVSSEIVTLTSSQDSEITQNISDLTDNPDKVYIKYIRRLKDCLNQTVERHTGGNEFQMVEYQQYDQCDISEIEPLFRDSNSTQLLKIMDAGEYEKYLRESGEVFFRFFKSKHAQHTEIVFLYMSIILSHMLSNNFGLLDDDRKYDDLIKKHKLCFLETKNYTVSRVLGEIPVQSERYFAITNFFDKGKKDTKVKNELLKSIDEETMNMFDFLKVVKKNWTIEQVELYDDHVFKYEIVKSDLNIFFKAWNNLSNELFKKGFRYLFGSFLIPALNNNSCSAAELDLYNKFFNLNKNRTVTVQIDKELKKLEQGQYNLLAEHFKKVDIIKNLEEQTKGKKKLKRCRDDSCEDKEILNKFKTIGTKIVADPGDPNKNNDSVNRPKSVAVVYDPHENINRNEELTKNLEVDAEKNLGPTHVVASVAPLSAGCVSEVVSAIGGSKLIAPQVLPASLPPIALESSPAHASPVNSNNHQCGEEQYYDEIFQYLTSIKCIEEQIQGCDIDVYLKTLYPQWNARNMSKETLSTHLMTRFKINIYYSSLHGLMYDNWIKDDIIACMTEIINLMFFCINDPNEHSTVHIWNTFLFSKLFENKVYDYNFVKNWTKKMNPFNFKKMFFPINISNNHWILVYCQIDSSLMKIEITCYDSFGKIVGSEKYCIGIKMWFESEFHKRNMVNKYTYTLNDKSIKQQFDSFNCGVIVIQNMIHLALNKKIKVYSDPQELRKLRSLIAFICTDKDMMALSFVSTMKMDLVIVEEDMMKHRVGSSTSLKSVQGQTPIEIDCDSLIDRTCSQEELFGRYSDQFVSPSEYLELLKMLKIDLQMK